jgi:hypothetical protein
MACSAFQVVTNLHLYAKNLQSFTVRPKGEEKFTFILPEIDVNFNCFCCNFDEFPTICGGINAIKNIDLG